MILDKLYLHRNVILLHYLAFEHKLQVMPFK